jgi:iron complex outermembrane recepter protein
VFKKEYLVSLKHKVWASALIALFCGGYAQAQQSTAKGNLADKSIEDLMNIEVTSASKKAEKLSGAPAAIFVITGDDIRRGGFSSIPDALRMAPGLHVSQQSAHVWIVAARGFSSLFNAEMLVLIDGRLVYAPAFGGVWWDVQDPPLEDIERIEVIRGPGGTLWGADAVNGVINIITKESSKTQGAQVATSAGADEGYAARARYGGKFGDNLTYRAYGTSNDWLPTVNANGAENYDAWGITQGGGRLDWHATQKDTITFDGQGYSGRTRDALTDFSPTAPPALLDFSSIMKGGHVLGRWRHKFNERSTTDVLGYCDWTFRSEHAFVESRNTCDVEFQNTYSLTARQTLTWGGAVLTTRGTEQYTFTTYFVPPLLPETTTSAFLQYDVDLVPDKLRVIAGSKFEHDSYTGFQYQPQIRAVWTPKPSHTLWAAVSRVVQTTTDADYSMRVQLEEVSNAPPTFLELVGNPDLKAVVAYAFESGYRYEWKQTFSLDAALYYNDYEGLVGSAAPGAPIINSSPFYIELPLLQVNLGSGQTHGVELYMKYTPIRRWTVSTGITELRGNSVAGLIVPAATNDPRQQLNVQSRFDLTRHVNFDAAYYYYDAIPFTLPPVNRVDVGLSSKPIRGFTFSAWGRNLQSERHQETAPFILPAGEIRRSVVFKLLWESNSDRATAR